MALKKINSTITAYFKAIIYCRTMILNALTLVESAVSKYFIINFAP